MYCFIKKWPLIMYALFTDLTRARYGLKAEDPLPVPI
jgi:hypothetical protein